MYIDQADVDLMTATNSDPGLPYPFDLDVPVDQNVKMRISVLLELQNPNVLRRAPMMALQINPQLGERRVQMANRISFDLFWIERQSDESAEMQSLGGCS